MKSTQRVRSERTPVKPRPEPAALDLAGLREQVSLVREALDDLVIVATDATAPSGQRICTRASNRRDVQRYAIEALSQLRVLECEIDRLGAS